MYMLVMPSFYHSLSLRLWPGGNQCHRTLHHPEVTRVKVNHCILSSPNINVKLDLWPCIEWSDCFRRDGPWVCVLRPVFQFLKCKILYAIIYSWLPFFSEEVLKRLLYVKPCVTLICSRYTEFILNVQSELKDQVPKTIFPFQLS